MTDGLKISFQLARIIGAVVFSLGVIGCQPSTTSPITPPLTEAVTLELSDESTAPPNDQEKIKAEVLDTLNLAYSLKQSSLHDLTKDGLEQAYTDEALQDRTHVVDLATSENCYWNIDLVQDDQIEFQHVGEDSVLVRALRVESREHICNGVVNAINTNEADRYYISFLLVRRNDKWLVASYDVSDVPDN